MRELKGRAPNQYLMRCIAVLTLVHAVDLGTGSQHSLGEQATQFERLAGFAPPLGPFGGELGLRTWTARTEEADVMSEEPVSTVVTPRGRTLAAHQKLAEAGRNFTPLSSSSLEADKTQLTSWVQELELELGPSSLPYHLRDDQNGPWEEHNFKAWESPVSFLSMRLRSASQLVKRISLSARIIIIASVVGVFVCSAIAWRAHVNAREGSAVRIQAAYRGATERASILSAVSEADETRRALSDQQDES